MLRSNLVLAAISATLAFSPVTRATADGGDIAGGIIGGIIGGVIVNEAQKNRQRQVRTTTSTKRVYRPAVDTAARAENREVQTSLNYFGFPAGTPDGVMGRNSRGAVSQYQVHMGYPATGQLTQYEKDFLITSYHRAIAGGAVTNQQIAANPQGPRGLLITYRNEAAGFATPQAPAAAMPQATFVATPPATVVTAPTAPASTTTTTTTTVMAPGTADEEAMPMKKPGSALPNFMGSGEMASLASHCNKVSLLTNTNGGFTTAASMTDASFALNEQFCLARTYAIAEGEELAEKVPGVSPQQIAEQCEAFGPAMKDHVAALSLKPLPAVVQDVSGFVLETGMSPAQLAGTAKICLSVGYRTDDMDVAIGSGLLLVTLGERVYAELLGHHLAQGFGASRRADLSLAWYEMGLDAVDNGATAAFAPGQPERNALIRKAAFALNGNTRAQSEAETVQPAAAALPSFTIAQ